MMCERLLYVVNKHIHMFDKQFGYRLVFNQNQKEIKNLFEIWMIIKQMMDIISLPSKNIEPLLI